MNFFFSGLQNRTTNRNQNFQKGEKVWILRKLPLFLQYRSTKKIRENMLRTKRVNYDL